MITSRKTIRFLHLKWIWIHSSLAIRHILVIDGDNTIVNRLKLNSNGNCRQHLLLLLLLLACFNQSHFTNTSTRWQTEHTHTHHPKMDLRDAMMFQHGISCTQTRRTNCIIITTSTPKWTEMTAFNGLLPCCCRPRHTMELWQLINRWRFYHVIFHWKH